MHPTFGGCSQALKGASKTPIDCCGFLGWETLREMKTREFCQLTWRICACPDWRMRIPCRVCPSHQGPPRSRYPAGRSQTHLQEIQEGNISFNERETEKSSSHQNTCSDSQAAFLRVPKLECSVCCKWRFFDFFPLWIAACSTARERAAFSFGMKRPFIVRKFLPKKSTTKTKCECVRRVFVRRNGNTHMVQRWCLSPQMKIVQKYCHKTQEKCFE